MIFASMKAQRIVLIEQFTNSGCPPCASSTPSILQYAEDHSPSVVAISYHTSFPYNDSMYYENPSESSQRVAFYNVTGVPHTVVDGNYYSGSSAGYIPVQGTSISTRAAVPVQYDILSPAAMLSPGTLQASAVFESLKQGNTNNDLRAYLVVVEQNVLKSSYSASPGKNSELQYKYVMRKMLPDAGGMQLKRKELNGKDTLTASWSLQHIKSAAELRVIAFVQNVSTKEIYQAYFITPSVSVTGVQAPPLQPELALYPNPATASVTLETASPLKSEISVQDIFGRKVSSSQPDGISSRITLSLANLSPGLYFVKIEDKVYGNRLAKLIVK